MTTKAQRTRTAAIERLRDLGLKPGSTVYTTNVHTSRSGMTRYLKVTVVGSDGQIVNITGPVCDLVGYRWSQDYGAAKVEGVGMDMGFALVYSLSRMLFPNGHDCTGAPGCPSNDHSNDYNEAAHRADTNLGIERPGRRDEDFAAWRAEVQRILDEELGYRAGRHHADGGYALTQRWV